MVDSLKWKVSWKIANHTESIFKWWTDIQISHLLGTHLEVPKGNSKKEPTTSELTLLSATAPPASFDARTKWPKCISPVGDQGNCGSCWAFAASSVLSDGICVASNSTNIKSIAPQDAVSCDTSDYWCNWGYLSNVFNYFTRTWSVTSACFPYTSGTSWSVPKCPIKCSKTTDAFIKYQCQANGIINVWGNIASIQTALSTTGPLVVGFNVYQDFLNYASGVYYYHSWKLLWGHAVKLIGYGTDPATKFNYWILQNSWGVNWGMKWYFWMKQGQCGIESQVIGCKPILK